MLKSKVGVEAEFLLLNTKGEVIIPPKHWDRDGFPLLGEIRGDSGAAVPETVANFTKKLMETTAKLNKGCQLVMKDVIRVRLATYKAAMKQVTEVKSEQLGKVKSIHGINIDDFSDQVISNGKIQGVNASCGLHIHFSCGESIVKEIENVKYEPVVLPITLASVEDENSILKEMIKAEVHLYSKVYLSEKDTKKISAFASVLTKPAIEYIVKEMDKEFFERFAPKKEDRTKYRQPGFYELKPYGFEYRSLPANNDSIKALPEIVTKAFKLLESLEN